METKALIWTIEMGVFLEIQQGYLGTHLSAKVKRQGPKNRAQNDQSGSTCRPIRANPTPAYRSCIGSQMTKPFWNPQTGTYCERQPTRWSRRWQIKATKFLQTILYTSTISTRKSKSTVKFRDFYPFFFNNLTRLLYCNNLCIDVVELFGR